jgi:hypothetical protein
MPRGAGVIATHDYISQSGTVTCLAAFLVLERRRSEGEVYCFPLEGRHVPESAQECAARALDEELHLRGLPAAALCAPAFAYVGLPGLHLYVAQQPGPSMHAGGECGTYSRGEFLVRRRRLESSKSPQRDYLETHAFVHADVASLLADGAGAIRARDHLGAPLRLRGICYTSLQSAEVQAALHSALGNFYGRHPHLRPQHAGQAQQPPAAAPGGAHPQAPLQQQYQKHPAQGGAPLAAPAPCPQAVQAPPPAVLGGAPHVAQASS